MDVPRTDRQKRIWLKRTLIGVCVALLVSLFFFAQSRITNAAPSVDIDSLKFAPVVRTEFVQNIRGLGKLEPEEIRWLSARTSGIVTRQTLKPGARVNPGSEVLTLVNPELTQELRDAKRRLELAEAQRALTEAQQESKRLALKQDEVRLKSELQVAQFLLDAYQDLIEKNAATQLNLIESQAEVAGIEEQIKIQDTIYDQHTISTEAFLARDDTEILQARDQIALLESQINDLSIRSALSGYVQAIAVEEGQRVAAGDILARVADTSRLMAVVQIPERQAGSIAIGQTAEVVILRKTLKGTVSLVSPTVENGLVAVEVTIDAPLPSEARPDMTVEATIEIRSMGDSLVVERPLFARANRPGILYRKNGNGMLERRDVEYGEMSSQSIQILNGLENGDTVVLSDLSEWNNHSTLSLK